MKRAPGLSIVLLTACAAGSAAAEARFGPEHLKDVVRVSDPRLSPDGGRVAALVSRVNEAENRFATELVVVEVATKSLRTLARRSGLASPRWSRDGARLAFLATDGAGQDQVFDVDARDGSGERQLTRVPDGILQFAQSPDGKDVAYVTPDPRAERTGLDRFNDSFEVGHDSYLTTAVPRAAHLWLSPVAGGMARRLTSGGSSLATSLGASGLSFAPDGRQLAYTRTRSPHSGDAGATTVETVDLADGRIRELTDIRASAGSAAFSPDGRRVAYLAPRDGDPASGNALFAVSAEGGTSTSLSGALDRSPTFYTWAGATLVMGANDGTRVALFRVSSDAAPRPLSLGAVVEVTDVDAGPTGALAFTGSEAARPTELYFLVSEGGAPQRLTDFGAPVVALPLGRTEGRRFRSADGVESDAVLTLPPDFDPKRRWPLVLYVHGGPTGASNEGFSELAQLLAARGFVVLQPNYRGSDNLGNAFQRGIVAGAGSGPGRDVAAAVDGMKALGYVDPDRIAVSGWSYGGFMTVWMIGHYPGFKAAVAGAAALDLFDMYALSDLNVAVRHAITGSPWTEGRAAHYREESPLESADRIETPTLILSCTGDSRVAVSQSYKLFRALEDRGVETKFVAYPCSSHFPSDPVRQRDVYTRWADWLEARVRGGASR